MTALPCPVANRFAAADQAYATISQFLGSEEPPSHCKRKKKGPPKRPRDLGFRPQGVQV